MGGSLDISVLFGSDSGFIVDSLFIYSLYFLSAVDLCCLPVFFTLVS